jgi:hypothetical protein
MLSSSASAPPSTIHDDNNRDHDHHHDEIQTISSPLTTTAMTTTTPRAMISPPPPTTTTTTTTRHNHHRHHQQQHKITPTRTIRLTGAEEAQRHSSSSRIRNGQRHDQSILISSLYVTNRPRSNPHTRTPMRYQSPLQHNEFHRDIRRPVEVVVLNNDTPPQSQPQQTQVPVERSRKQEHLSHRKIRRWNQHERMVDEEMNPHIQQIIRQAEKEMHLYRSVYDPNQHKPSQQMEQLRIVIIIFLNCRCI